MSSAKDTKPTDETHDTTVETTADSTTTAEAKKGAPQASPFDDEDDDDLEVHPAVSAVPPTTETPTVAATGNTTPPTSNTAAPTERETKLAILTEAFPTVEKEVCEFVLESHRGNVEASINALLEISDPEFQAEPAPPAPAPVPVASHVPTHLAPPLPQRQPDALAEGVTNLNLNQDQPREIDVSGQGGRTRILWLYFPSCEPRPWAVVGNISVTNMCPPFLNIYRFVMPFHYFISSQFSWRLHRPLSSSCVQTRISHALLLPWMNTGVCALRHNRCVDCVC